MNGNAETNGTTYTIGIEPDLDAQDWFDEVFPHPDRVNRVMETEYLAIYDVVEQYRDDPVMVLGILKEFAAWAIVLSRKLQEVTV